MLSDTAGGAGYWRLLLLLLLLLLLDGAILSGEGPVDNCRGATAGINAVTVVGYVESDEGDFGAGCGRLGSG